MKALKVFYALSFILCLIQLVIWLFSPFSGVGSIYNMVKDYGFYTDSPSERIDALSGDWGMSVGTFKIVNQIIAFIYFICLILAVLSILFLKKINKRLIYIGASFLFVVSACILFILWMQKS